MLHLDGFLMANGKTIRILIVDDHAMFRQVVRSILKPYPNIEVIGEASDGDEAVVRVGQLKPDVVLMDINMQKMDGVTAARLIKVQYPEVAILGLSAKAKHYDIYAMQKAGAFEVLSKEQTVHELYAAIQRAVAAVQPVLIMEQTPSPDKLSTQPATTDTQSTQEPKA
jgi:DNA-binding NarL/FixJ family response regulator